MFQLEKLYCLLTKECTIGRIVGGALEMQLLLFLLLMCIITQYFALPLAMVAVKWSHSGMQLCCHSHRRVCCCRTVL